MVNLGGRSKGCTTCRKRRVKCDEGHPTCLRCRKSNLECDGPRAVTFVVGKVVASRRSTTVGARKSGTNISYCHIPQVALLSSNEYEVYVCYTLRHLRHGGLIELTTRNIKHADIAPDRATIHRGDISHQAILSFATMFFGTQHHQAHITRLGFAIYGMVLQRLNQALSDPAYNTNDDLIYAVVTLGLLEIFVSTGSGNHLKHIAGLERLLALRDNRLLISYESSELHRTLRPMILLGALRLRQASFLARPEWKKQLREHIDSTDELQQEDLFDVLADCTVAVFRGDQILGTSHMPLEMSTQGLNKLKQDALSLLAQLSSWKKRWDSDKKHAATISPIIHNQPNQIPSHPGEGLLPFTTTLEHPTESVATIRMLYNVAVIHVLQILALLTSPRPERLPHESPTTSPPVIPPLQASFTEEENFLLDPPHFQKIWSHPPINTKHPPNSYLLAQRAPILDICRSIPYHISSPQKASSSVLHWACATIWIKLGGEDSVVGRWVLRLLVEKSLILSKTSRILAG